MAIFEMLIHSQQLRKYLSSNDAEAIFNVKFLILKNVHLLLKLSAPFKLHSLDAIKLLCCLYMLKNAATVTKGGRKGKKQRRRMEDFSVLVPQIFPHLPFYFIVIPLYVYLSDSVALKITNMPLCIYVQ